MTYIYKRMYVNHILLVFFQLNVVDRDSTAYCGSVNDPHMRTFDGR